MKLCNLSTSDFISMAAIVISVVALLSSIKSCQISQNSLDVSTLEYNSNRSLVLKGEVQDANSDIKVTPQDTSFLLQEVYYQFPSEIGTGRKLASAPNYVLSFNREIEYFRKLLAVRYRKEGGETTIGKNARMPFLIETFSTVRGQGYRDRSIYTLNFEFEVPGDPRFEPRITIRGIAFCCHIDRGDNAEESLEKNWAEINKVN